MPMFDVHAFILVGGESSRMGADKARLAFGQQTSVELIASALQSISQKITTVGWRQQEGGALPNIPDLRPGWGPLAGIDAALRHASSEYCLIVACDFPFVKALKLSCAVVSPLIGRHTVNDTERSGSGA